MATPFDKLPRIEKQAVGEMLKVISEAQKQARRIVADAASSPAAVKDARTRDAVYQEILATYKDATKPLDDILRRLITKSGAIGNQAAGLNVASGVDIVQFNEKRLRQYWQYVAPENSKSLAATLTENMSNRAVSQLRTAFVDNFREAGVQGWTARETQKNLQLKWDALAGDRDAFRFVDRGGKVWENARYTQMLVRTNSQRVSRESFVDTLAESGIGYARISNDSPLESSTEVCARWAGKIISVGGTDPDFPSYQDALDDGMFHPNCLHRLEPVLPEQVEAAR
jgi:hypothetical protein